MFIPVIPVAHRNNVVHKTIVYQDTVLPLKDIGANLVLTKLNNISESDFEDVLNIILKSNQQVLFNTVQYSKRDKILYFYTNKKISTSEYYEYKEKKNSKYYNIDSNQKVNLEDYLCTGKKNEDDILASDFYSFILDKFKRYRKEKINLENKLEKRIAELAPDEKIKTGRCDIKLGKLENTPALIISLVYKSFSDFHYPEFFIDANDYTLLKIKDNCFCVNEEDWIFGCKDIFVEMINFLNSQDNFLSDSETRIYSHYFYNNGMFNNKLSFDICVTRFLGNSITMNIKHVDNNGNKSEVERRYYIEKDDGIISCEDKGIEFNSLNYDFYDFYTNHKNIFNELYLSIDDYAKMFKVDKEKLKEEYNNYVERNKPKTKENIFSRFFKKNKKCS